MFRAGVFLHLAGAAFHGSPRRERWGERPAGTAGHGPGCGKEGLDISPCFPVPVALVHRDVVGETLL